MRYMKLDLLTHQEKMIYSGLSTSDSGSMIQFMITNTLEHGDIDAFRELISNLHSMMNDNLMMMISEIGAETCALIDRYYNQVLRTYKMIERNIDQCDTYYRLAFCEQWIDDKIQCAMLRKQLMNRVQLKQVDLQCFQYA